MPTSEELPFPPDEPPTSPLFNVLLFDDDEHSYDYVIEMMMLLFSYTQERAFEVAYNVDNLGEAIVKTCEEKEAHRAVEAIRSFGPDPNMPTSTGSMQAAVVPARD